MKRKLFVLVLVACSLLSCTDGIWNAIHDLEDKYSDLDGRVAKLEELCKEMNTNISSLQTLVSVILSNDYIISITPITKEGKEIGYTMTFAIHEPITIYHGQDGADGKDGENGKDGKDGKDGLNGQDGVTPIIGVAQDEVDHAYYWTLNGEWLLDVNGNRIPLTSRDGINGQDGQNGKDGKDGKDGVDGVNGITPQLKIEGGYWFVSTDNGTTWTQLGKAVGENGQNGQDGKDGKDGTNGKDGKDGKDGEKGEKGDPGDTMFSSVTQDDDYVYFTLSNGTVIKIPVASEDYGTDPENRVEVVNGVIMTGFSVAADRQVYFTNGNLQYQPSTGAWRFAKQQYDNLGLSINGITSTYNGWIDFFNASDISGCAYMDTCRILTDSEWNYLINRHSENNYKFAFGRVNNVFGLLILPDIFIQPRGIAQLLAAPYPASSEGYLSNYFYTANIISSNEWREYENIGVIFLPMTNSWNESSSKGFGYYWCNNLSSHLNFVISISPYKQSKPGCSTLTGPHAIRLVKDVE